MKKALHNCLTKISLLAQSRRQETKGKVPSIFAQTLQADGCAVYILDKRDYVLEEAYAQIPFHLTWRQYGKDIPLIARYLEEPDKIAAELGQKTWSRVLILPVPAEDKVKGLLIAYWTDGSMIDGWAEEISELWQAIAGQLAVIYYWQPLAEQLRQREESLQMLFRKTDQDWEENRKQVARELYFEVGQSLTSLMIQIQLLQQSDDLEYVQGRLGGFKHIISQNLEEVLRLSRSQGSVLLDKLGLPAALASYAQEYEENTKTPVQINCSEFTKPLSGQLETIVFRCMQEALAIANNGAEDNALIINLVIKGDNLFFQILYKGCRPVEHSTSEEVLLRVQERTRQAKGKFWISNQKEQNQILNILLPLSEGTGGKDGKDPDFPVG